MPSACGTSRLRARSSNIAALGGIDAVSRKEAVVDLRRRLGQELGAAMSKMSSKCWWISSRPLTFSACARVPLVRMNLRPGSCSIAAPAPGWASSGEWSMSCTIFEEIVGLDAVLLHQPAQRGAVAPVIVLLDPVRLVVADLEKRRHSRGCARRPAAKRLSARDRACCRGRRPRSRPSQSRGRRAAGPRWRVVVATVPGEEV